MGVLDSLEVLLLGPREWKPLATIRGLWKVEALFWAHYLWRFAPLDIWLQARELNRPFGDFRYGETLWSSGAEILREAGVGPQDHLIDLGCGRGKMVFLARILSGARATGVELLPSYLYVARRIARWLHLDRVRFLGQDFTQVDVSQASVIYLAGSIFSEETRAQLALLIDDLPVGARWISVTWPWLHPALELQSCREYLFSWGREKVYRYTVCDPESVMAPDEVHGAVGAQLELLGSPTDPVSGHGKEP